MNGALCSTKERTRFNTARKIIIHFSFLKTPVSILLKNIILMIKEKPVGIHKPIKFKTKAGFSKEFKKIRTKEKTKIITE